MLIRSPVVMLHYDCSMLHSNSEWKLLFLIVSVCYSYWGLLTCAKSAKRAKSYLHIYLYVYVYVWPILYCLHNEFYNYTMYVFYFYKRNHNISSLHTFSYFFQRTKKNGQHFEQKRKNFICGDIWAIYNTVLRLKSIDENDQMHNMYRYK